MAKERESTLKGRDARTGQFIPVKEARERPNTTVVERVPLPASRKGEGRVVVIPFVEWSSSQWRLRGSPGSRSQSTLPLRSCLRRYGGR